MYRELKTERIVATLDALCSRIRERFPDAGLSHVGHELLDFARETNARIERLRRPHWFLRVGSAVLLALALILTVVLVRSLRISMGIDDIAELVQGLDAVANELILLTVGFVSLWTLENRLKRREALRAVHELRSLAHVIDMHQLTKDPDVILGPARPTPSSPQRTLTPFELARYLDYCSEMLSLVGKLAALHVQYFRDPVVLEAVNDVEALADGLARKIWQKLTMLEAAANKQAPPPDVDRE
jgi:hypothetical protein